MIETFGIPDYQPAEFASTGLELVVHTGDAVTRIDDDHDIWAVPVHRLLT